MSLAPACLGTLSRTLVICLVAWPVCAAIERWLRSLSDRARSVALIGLLAPFCFPELLVGYAFRDLALFHPRWAELLCSGLLFVRVVPVGAVALLMAPPPECDAAAIHCRMMLVRDRRRCSRAWFELAMCYWHGPISHTLPALGLMAVVTFQEFELAALMMTTSWTDWFVAAERVGLERGEMLRQTAWPLLMQLPVLVGVVGWLGHVGWTPRPSQAIETRTDEASILRAKWHIAFWFAPTYVATALVAGCVAPMSLIGWRTIDGLGLLARQRTQQLGLLREMVVSLAVAVCAGLTAWAICRGMSLINPTRERGFLGHFTRSPRSRVGLVRVFILWLPGLLGSLLLSLGAVALFQISWLRPVYDTPLPWVLALTVWLLPRAAVLQLWLDAVRPSEAVHLAEMLTGRGGQAEGRGEAPLTLTLSPEDGGEGTKPKAEVKTSALHPSTFNPQPSTLLWRLRDQPQFLAMSLLCYWAYCDLPTAYLLAPTGMAPGLVRLYNFMHFGRSAALSAEACLFFGGPLVLVAGVMLAARWWRAS